MKKYLTLHQLALVTFLDQLEHNLIDEADIEVRLPRSFLQLHEAIKKILQENDIQVPLPPN
jgi:hypothetical protein